MLAVGYFFMVSTLLLALVLPAASVAYLRRLVERIAGDKAGAGLDYAAAGLILAWLFCVVVVVVDYARLNRSSWLADALARVMSQSSSFGLFLSVGVVLYIARHRFRILYGMIETVGAAVVLWFSLPPYSHDLMTNATTLVACIYFLFRGLDNVRFSLEQTQ